MFIALSVRRLPKQALVAFCCLCSVSAFAQVPARNGPLLAATTDPGNPRARVQPLVYVSVFGPYRAFADEPITSWRDANELTERIGGWRAYAREAREAREPEAAPKNPSAPMPAKEASGPTPPSSPATLPPSPAAPPQGHGGHTKP
jgi:hypothetical protein